MKATNKPTFTRPIFLLFMQLCALYSIYHVLTLGGNHSQSDQMQLIFSATVIVSAAVFTIHSLSKLHTEESPTDIQKATF